MELRTVIINSINLPILFLTGAERLHEFHSVFLTQKTLCLLFELKEQQS